MRPGGLLSAHSERALSSQLGPVSCPNIVYNRVLIFLRQEKLLLTFFTSFHVIRVSKTRRFSGFGGSGCSGTDPYFRDVE